MATASKTSKPAKPTAASATKPAARSAVKTKAKAAAAPAKPKPTKSAVKKPVAAKPGAAKPAVSLRPAVQAATAPTKPVKPAKLQISAEQRRHYVEVAAYFIAERNGFAANSVLEHWVQAEAEIDRLLREGKINL